MGIRQAVASVAFLGVSLGAAQAADLWNDGAGSFKDGGFNGAWIVTLGGYGGVELTYPGASHESFAFRPIIDIHRAGAREWLNLPTDAGSLTLYNIDGRFRAGAAIDWLNSRNHGDDSEIRALHDINYTLELGGFAEYYPVPSIRTRVELLQGVSGADGLAANFSADWIYQPNTKWLFTVGPRLKAVNTQFQSEFFSVSAAEAASSHIYTPYHASGGINEAGIDVTARYQVNDRLSLRAFGEWDRLLGDAADSPITKRGSENQFQIGIGAAYSFSYSNGALR